MKILSNKNGGFHLDNTPMQYTTNFNFGKTNNFQLQKNVICSET